MWGLCEELTITLEAASYSGLNDFMPETSHHFIPPSPQRKGKATLCCSVSQYSWDFFSCRNATQVTTVLPPAKATRGTNAGVVAAIVVVVIIILIIILVITAIFLKKNLVHRGKLYMNGVVSRNVFA